MYLFPKKFIWSTSIVLFFLVVFLAYYFGVSAPRSFPKEEIVTVEPGFGLLELSTKLKKDGIIRSPLWFRSVAIMLGGERAMQAGDYYLPEVENVYELAKRVVTGDYKIERVKITIPEGFTVKKISALFDERFVDFDQEMFEILAQEGYMFPDTYFIPVNATASSTINTLRENFIRRIFGVMPQIEGFGESLERTITMASILEGEAKTQEDREIVAGILWKRIELGMPLQVDASFVYVNGKTTKDLTLADLKIDSPYNTYLYTDLPPTPISNPGLESITAAINPKETPYLYFLTGDDGEMYYAITFDDHIKNKEKYLKN